MSWGPKPGKQAAKKPVSFHRFQKKTVPAKQYHEQSTNEFLADAGLEALGLTFKRFLPTVGFRRVGEYVAQLDRYVMAQYSDTLFETLAMPDGNIYNITLDFAGADNYRKLLETQLEKFRSRLTWMTRGSLLAFGRLQHSKMVVLLDWSEMTVETKRFYRQVLIKLVQEQLQYTEAFVIMRCETYMAPSCFVEGALRSGSDSEAVMQAASWAETLEPLPAGDSPDLLDGLSAASNTCPEDGAVLLVTDGPRRTGHKLILRAARTARRVIHTAAMAMHDSETLSFLRELSKETGGLSHIFSGDIEDAVESTGLTKPKCDSLELKALRNEISICTGTLATLRALVLDAKERMSRPQPPPQPKVALTTEQWLQRNGIRARKLRLFDALAPYAFPHVSDDVAILKGHSKSIEDFKAAHVPGAEVESREVHAQVGQEAGLTLYRWHNGATVYVFVPEGLARDFERRGKDAISEYRVRLKSLQDGSFSLFGKLEHSGIILLIAAGRSMRSKWVQVVRKIEDLIHEQIQGERKFNIIAYGDEPRAWRVGVVEASKSNCSAAIEWLNALKPDGATNLSSGLRQIFQDPEAGAAYLVSDGMFYGNLDTAYDEAATLFKASAQLQAAANPDAPAEGKRCILSTISYSCADAKANRLLHDLAVLGGGGFQYFIEGLAGSAGLTPEQMSLLGPPSRGTNPDITLLNGEIAACEEEIRKVLELREECRKHEAITKSGRKHELKYELTMPPPDPMPQPVKGLGRKMIDAATIRRKRSQQNLSNAIDQGDSATLLREKEKGWEKYGKSSDSCPDIAKCSGTLDRGNNKLETLDIDDTGGQLCNPPGIEVIDESGETIKVHRSLQGIARATACLGTTVVNESGAMIISATGEVVRDDEVGDYWLDRRKGRIMLSKQAIMREVLEPAAQRASRLLAISVVYRGGSLLIEATDDPISLREDCVFLLKADGKLGQLLTREEALMRVEQGATPVTLKSNTTAHKEDLTPEVVTETDRWIRLHGLKASRLRLEDALASTATKRSGKYIPSLGKTVYAKTFDDNFPHRIVNENGEQIRVFPLATDLESYIGKLDGLLKTVRLKLVKKVEEFCTESNGAALISRLREAVDTGQAIEDIVDGRTSGANSEHVLALKSNSEIATLIAEIDRGVAFMLQAHEFLTEQKSVVRQDYFSMPEVPVPKPLPKKNRNRKKQQDAFPSKQTRRPLYEARTRNQVPSVTNSTNIVNISNDQYGESWDVKVDGHQRLRATEKLYGISNRKARRLKKAPTRKMGHVKKTSKSLSSNASLRKASTSVSVSLPEIQLPDIDTSGMHPTKWNSEGPSSYDPRVWMRSSGPRSLSAGDAVLARWNEDGLFYPASVISCSDGNRVMLQFDGVDAQVSDRPNIFPLEVRMGNSRVCFSNGDLVLYPKLAGGFAPGTIVGVLGGGQHSDVVVHGFSGSVDVYHAGVLISLSALEHFDICKFINGCQVEKFDRLSSERDLLIHGPQSSTTGFKRGEHVLYPEASTGCQAPATIIGQLKGQAGTILLRDTNGMLQPADSSSLVPLKVSEFESLVRYIDNVRELSLEVNTTSTSPVTTTDSQMAKENYLEPSSQDDAIKTSGANISGVQSEASIDNPSMSKTGLLELSWDGFAQSLHGSQSMAIPSNSEHDCIIAIVFDIGQDNIKCAKDVLNFGSYDLQVLIDTEVQMSTREAEDFLMPIRGSDEYPALVNKLISGSAHVSALCGPDACAKWHQACTVCCAKTSREKESFSGTRISGTSVRDLAFFFTPNDPALVSLAQSRNGKERGKNLIDQPALARWGGDGWFYPVIVRCHLYDDVFVVEDEDHTRSTAFSSTLIAVGTGARAPSKIGDAVLAEHPNFARSFSPAQVNEISGSTVDICFFDGLSVVVGLGECVAFPKGLSYAEVCGYIHAAEDELVGKFVLYRADENGHFYQGTVVENLGNDLFRVAPANTDGAARKTIDQIRSHVFLLSAQQSRTRQWLPGDGVLVQKPGLSRYETAVVVESRATDVVIEFLAGGTDSCKHSAPIWVGHEYATAAGVLCAPEAHHELLHHSRVVEVRLAKAMSRLEQAHQHVKQLEQEAIEYKREMTLAAEKSAQELAKAQNEAHMVRRQSMVSHGAPEEEVASLRELLQRLRVPKEAEAKQKAMFGDRRRQAHHSTKDDEGYGEADACLWIAVYPSPAGWSGLHFEPGDLASEHGRVRTDENSLLVTIKSKKGLVPVEYFRRLHRVPDNVKRHRMLDVLKSMRTDDQWKDPTHRLIHGTQRLARFDYTPDSKDTDHLQLKRGDVIIPDKSGAARNDGLFAATVNGASGLVPMRFTEPDLDLYSV